MNYTIASNNIIFENGYSLNFEYPIKNTLLINNIVIILVDPPFDRIYNQNVFAVRISGDFLWRIGKVSLYNNSNNCPYVGIIVNDSNQLVLFNWCDTAIIVDPETGEMLNKYHTK